MKFMGKYGFDPEVSTAITQMETVATEYDSKIKELSALIKEITLSDDWKDLSVKSSFLSTLDGYMKVYESLLFQMRFQIKELKNKVGRMSDLESTFAQG
jgi:hypothetical protein